jgi:MFS family permease
LLSLCRFVQGIGGGGFLPSAAGIVADEFPRSRGQAIGLFTSIMPFGQIIGPNLGGWLTTVMGWRSVFWINIPLVMIAIIPIMLMVRPGKREKGTIDFPGALMFTAALLTFMVSISLMGKGSAPLPVIVALFVTSIASMTIFLRRESRISNPIVDLEILKRRPFMSANIYNFLYGVCVFGMFSFVPLYAVSVYKMTTLESGLILTPRSICMMIASTVSSLSLMKWGYRVPMLAGTAFVGISLILLGMEPTGVRLLGIELSGSAILFVTMGISGLGMGIAAPASSNACIELMPERITAITGIRMMFRTVGGAIGTVVCSLVLNNSSDITVGFHFLFFALALIMFCTAPIIFAMPSSARALPATEKAV